MVADDGRLAGVDVRLARVEERQTAGAERMTRIEAALVDIKAKLDSVAQDVHDAKVGIRIGRVLWAPAAGAVGWAAHYLWPFK